MRELQPVCMYVCVCVRPFVCNIELYMYVSAHAYVRTYMYMYIRTYMYVWIHRGVYLHMYIHVCTCEICLYGCVCMHKLIHTYVRIICT